MSSSKKVKVVSQTLISSYIQVVRNSLHPILLFIFITTVFFTSSVGLMNSMDAAQFFTTEALIQHKNLDLIPFKDDPHAFINPDFYYYKGQMLGVRGYLLSILTSPLHFISPYIAGLFRVDNFPSGVLSRNFPYELSIVSFFTLFSSTAMMIFWKLQKDLTGRPYVATVITLLVAFGSYIWKYSSSYTRQGIEVFLIASSIYSLYQWFASGEKSRLWMGIFLLLWSFSFGIDVFLFLAISLYIAIYGGSMVIKKDRLKILIHIFKAGIPALFIIFLNVIGNYYWYDSFFYSQHMKYHFTEIIPAGKLLSLWTSTPLFPTIVYVLFSISALPKEIFSNFASYPSVISYDAGLSYAQKYTFYGFFTISSFVFWGVFALFHLTKLQKHLVLYCLVAFITGIVLNTKLLGFWGGNQYDVRYFYPYILFPSIFTGLGITKIWTMYKNRLYYMSIRLLVIVSWFVSILMGWWGVLNMFMPAQLGERKIWSSYGDGSFLGLWNATFMNWQNAWIGSLSALLLSLIFLMIYTLVFTKRNSRITIRSHY